MNKQELFDRIKKELENRLNTLNDKPEETIESTVKALWLFAAGFPVSAQKAVNMSLPDLTEKQIDNLARLIQARVENTPLAYITGRQSFMGIELLSDKRALIPRKETEILAQKAIELAKEISYQNNQISIMDVCCGAGNLGTAVAHYTTNCTVYSSDISYEAVELTNENIRLLNLTQRVFAGQGDMMSAFEKDEYYCKFDIVICNPPYISSAKVAKMDIEISMNEPAVAFDGGMLGIKIIQKLIQDAPRFLKESGWLVFEIGAGQGQFLTQLCERTQSFSKIETITDHSGIIRVISAQKSK